MKHVVKAYQYTTQYYDGEARHVTTAECESLTGVFHKIAVRLGAGHVKGEYDSNRPVHFVYVKEES